jgi:hypothetical protein
MVEGVVVLHEAITTYVRQRHEAMVRRFFPNWQLPGFFAGYRAARHDCASRRGARTRRC